MRKEIPEFKSEAEEFEFWSSAGTGADSTEFVDWSAAEPETMPNLKPTLQALEREESETDAWLVKLAEEALADPRPSVPAEEVFAEIRAKYGRGRRLSSRVDDEARN